MEQKPTEQKPTEQKPTEQKLVVRQRILRAQGLCTPQEQTQKFAQMDDIRMTAQDIGSRVQKNQKAWAASTLTGAVSTATVTGLSITGICVGAASAWL